MTEEKMLRDCRRMVLRIADAVRVLEEDMETPYVTVRRLTPGGVPVADGIDRLAESVGKTLYRSRRYEEDAGVLTVEDWFTYRGVRFYRRVAYQALGESGRKEAAV